MARPNNPHPPGSLAAEMWELDAEVTHLRRLLIVAVRRLLLSPW